MTTTTDIAAGTEVTVTLTGRVIHAHSRGIVVEYLSPEGFARRESFDTGSSAVTVTTAPGPDRTELARRERAARLIAEMCRDDDSRKAVQSEHVDRWNDAYADGTEVRYWTGVREGSGKVGRTDGAAWLLGGHTAVVRIHGVASCIALSHVEPTSEAGESA